MAMNLKVVIQLISSESRERENFAFSDIYMIMYNVSRLNALSKIFV